MILWLIVALLILTALVMAGGIVVACGILIPFAIKIAVITLWAAFMLIMLGTIAIGALLD